MPASPTGVAAQYATERHLRTRIETHERYSVGPGLEGTVDRLLALSGDEAVLDVGTGPGDFPGRLRREGHRGRIVGLDSRRVWWRGHWSSMGTSNSSRVTRRRCPSRMPLSMS